MPSAIEIDGVSVAYRTQDTDRPFPVLSNISVTLPTNCFTAVIGHNGSGKSTFAKVLAGLSGISKGSVRVLHSDSHGDKANPARVQLVLQNPDTQIIGETVLEDICFGMENIGVPSREMHGRALEALAQVGLHVPLHQKTALLSGGQKQLLAIASAIAMKPDIIVFDEATSMLDPLGRTQVLHTVKQLQRTGVTIVWITQFIPELALADRVLVLHEGTIVFHDTVEHFFYQRRSPNAPGPCIQGTRPTNQSHAPWHCEALGFVAPVTVQTVRALIANGIHFRSYPVDPSQFERALEELCQSGCRTSP